MNSTSWQQGCKNFHFFANWLSRSHYSSLVFDNVDSFCVTWWLLYACICVWNRAYEGPRDRRLATVENWMKKVWHLRIATVGHWLFCDCTHLQTSSVTLPSSNSVRKHVQWLRSFTEGPCWHSPPVMTAPSAATLWLSITLQAVVIGHLRWYLRHTWY